MEIKDRIKLIMEREEIQPRAFAEAIGVQQSTLSHILNDRNKPSLEVVMKIHQTYNYVNLEWLLYGKGQMSEVESNLQDMLSSENSINSANNSFASENRKEIALEFSTNSSEVADNQNVKYAERVAKKITEIRIFFDDNTYETFRPEK